MNAATLCVFLPNEASHSWVYVAELELRLELSLREHWNPVPIREPYGYSLRHTPLSHLCSSGLKHPLFFVRSVPPHVDTASSVAVTHSTWSWHVASVHKPLAVTRRDPFGQSSVHHGRMCFAVSGDIHDSSVISKSVPLTRNVHHDTPFSLEKNTCGGLVRHFPLLHEVV